MVRDGSDDLRSRPRGLLPPARVGALLLLVVGQGLYHLVQCGGDQRIRLRVLPVGGQRCCRRRPVGVGGGHRDRDGLGGGAAVGGRGLGRAGHRAKRVMVTALLLTHSSSNMQCLSTCGVLKPMLAPTV
jgi:hypothetical protein